MNYSRIQALTKLSMNDMRDGKYILRQEKTTLEDMKSTIMRIYQEKTQNADKYKYNTGKKNEFGDEIELFEPTVIILDSIATITMSLDGGDAKTLEKLEEISSQTDRMRLTGEIGRFFNEILPYLREANITLIAINQIKTKLDTGVFKSAPAFMYMKQDETLPGGWAPQFYAHIMLKFVAESSEKFNLEDDGFDGFGVSIAVLKSRTNQAGKACHMVYDKVRGIDSIRSTLRFAKDEGLLNGNRNKSYFLDMKDKSFSMTNVNAEFKERPELYKLMYDVVIPPLAANLSELTNEELENDTAVMDY